MRVLSQTTGNESLHCSRILTLLRLYFAAPRILFLLTKVLFLSSSFSSASSARVLLLPSFRLCLQLATLACLPTPQPVPDAAYLRPCVPWIRALASWQDASEEDRLHYPQAFIFGAGSQHLPQRGQGARKLRPHTFGGPLVSWNVLIVSLLQALNDDTKNLTETDTETFFPIPNFPKPIPRLFFRYQIFRNRY